MMMTTKAHELREKVADLCHKQWSHWMKYLFSKGIENEEGEVVIPLYCVERWKRQIKTEYSGLSASEQESDRTEADKFLHLISDELVDILRDSFPRKTEADEQIFHCGDCKYFEELDFVEFQKEGICSNAPTYGQHPQAIAADQSACHHFCKKEVGGE